ncbi:WD40 repeat domain-containing protein [Telmatocola sphagniphila]|uniref:WD40 repeat domain-containing protein n=1 Tax=Telmatocola sphagniphila TaxID=1123043 RepID=A0A8E6B3L6_9BACT|nr:WD40 repeat domain-containing protein [Telmatocola sphagniphila]QVL29928.1 WD40 repeat domain-containing protein [Telmatocola sphagniphila]
MSANPDKLKLIKEHSLKMICFGIAQVPKSSRFYLGGSDFKVYEVDLAANKFEPAEKYAHESYVTTLALSGNQLVSGGYDGKLIWWDTEAKKQIRSIEGHSRWIRKIALSPDGKILASVADDMVCRIWDLQTGKKIRELRGHAEKTPSHFDSMLYAVAFSPDGKWLATADKIGHIVLWDLESGKQLYSLEAPVMYTWDKVQRLHSIGGIRSLAFSPNGKLLAVGGTGKIGNIDHLEAKVRIEIFDLEAKKQIGEYVGDKSQGLINHMQFAPDGTWLIGAGGANDGCMVFLSVKDKKFLRQEKMGMHVHQFLTNEAADTIWSVGHNRLAIHELKA